MEYKTVRHAEVLEFDKAVNEAIADGYVPYGSPYVMPHSKATFICQAMTKGRTAAAEGVDDAPA